ncbi:MAG: hypothetical protein IJ404_04480 [Clostridia bacterium]|nr:hypothetical protein [Clostridia bacterium]
MKKIIILLLTASMIAAAFIGCDSGAFSSSSKDTNGNGLRDDVELNILKAHHKKNRDEEFRPDIHEIYYFGRYNGAYIVKIICGYAQSPDSKPTVDIDSMSDEKLFSSDKRGNVAWYNGEMRSILSLLEDGILNEDDINEIREKLKKYHLSNSN